MKSKKELNQLMDSGCWFDSIHRTILEAIIERLPDLECDKAKDVEEKLLQADEVEAADQIVILGSQNNDLKAEVRRLQLSIMGVLLDAKRNL